MTNEQAIDILNAVKFIIEDYTDEMEEAFDMAISALTAQEQLANDSPELDNKFGDLISRSAAVEAVKFGITYAKVINKSTGEVKELFKEGNKALNEAVERIKDLPSAQPEWEQKIEEYCKSAPSYVRNPLVWALYQTWKEYDERLFNHSRQAAGDTISRSERGR